MAKTDDIFNYPIVKAWIERCQTFTDKLMSKAREILKYSIGAA